MHATEVGDTLLLHHFDDLEQQKNSSTLGMWAIQRDKGGCPGVIDSDSCSGIVQKPWAFSHVLIPFTTR